MQKHIILLKLTKLLEVVPRFENRPIEPASPERKWLSEVGALLNKLDRAHYGSLVSTRLSFLKISPKQNADDIVGCAFDAVEAIKLDLELDGRSEIGTAYESGDIYTSSPNDYFDFSLSSKTPTNRSSSWLNPLKSIALCPLATTL